MIIEYEGHEIVITGNDRIGYKAAVNPARSLIIAFGPTEEGVIASAKELIDKRIRSILFSKKPKENPKNADNAWESDNAGSTDQSDNERYH